MKKTSLIWFGVFIILTIGAVFVFEKLVFSNNMDTSFEEKIREPAVAGQFYPQEKQELENMLKGFLMEANPPDIEGEPIGLLAPHAGYVFSGPVAAAGFKAIEGKEFDTVILIGDSHHEWFEGVSVWPAGLWRTPLGEVKVDQELAEKIISASPRFMVKDSAHLLEHSLEVEIPFLQMTLKKGFKILPIIFGSEDKDWQNLAKVIEENIKGKKVLIIASSDLSHYPPYDLAKEADLKTLKAIEKTDPLILREKIQELEKENIPNARTFICGQDAVKTLLQIAKDLKARAKVLRYANSGDSPFGEKNQVVGYGAVLFFKKGSFSDEEKGQSGQELNEKEQKELLTIARESVESFVKTGVIPDFKATSEKLKKNQGAFVTIKKNGQLRGCIGYTAQDRPLYQVVSQMAVAAAVQDYRFAPINTQELSELEYEISVLSPLKKINSPDKIQLGKHGVQAVAGKKSGLFLPQVATENNWDLETFLDQLMLKAGLWPDYWKKYPVDFYIFTAQIFGENNKDK